MRKEAEEWVKIAIEDLQSAEYLLEKSLFRMVCYHAQQAVEKVFKALLIEHGIDFPRTHNILDLLNAVKRLGYTIRLTTEDAIFLNSIYRARYPSDLGLLPSGRPTEEDARKALNMAKVTIEWVKGLK
ncbi:MAG: HEPN domain-containing protein [Nitrospira sp.]|nr:HEPN domain-containing protein [Nitrospira sp.]